MTAEVPESTVFGLLAMGAGGRPEPLFIPGTPDKGGVDFGADAGGLAPFWSSPMRPFTQSSSATAKKLLRSSFKEKITEFLILERTCQKMTKDTIIENFLPAHIPYHHVRWNLLEIAKVQ